MNEHHSDHVGELRPVDSSELAGVEGGSVLQILSAIATLALVAGQMAYAAAYEAGQASCEPAT